MAHMRLYREIAVRCARRLLVAGYKIPRAFPDATGANDPDRVLISYFNVFHRTIKSTPRSIRKAYHSAAAGDAEGEQYLLRKVSSGQNLRPHLSKRISNSTYSDGMLNEFGIHHFHLGLTNDKRNTNFIERTGNVLFAMVTDDVFYAIGIYPHDSWCNSEILDLVNKTWPSLLEKHKMPGFSKLSYDVSDDERRVARASKVNTVISLKDGSILLGPGGGFSADGTSSHVSQNILGLRRACASVCRDFLLERPQRSVTLQRFLYTNYSEVVLTSYRFLHYKTGILIPNIE